MKNLGLSLLAVAAMAASAAAAPISSVCSFETPAGLPARARFDIENNEVRSTLWIEGEQAPRIFPVCTHPTKRGLACQHEGADRRYELYPRIDDETNQVVGLRVLVYEPYDTDNPVPVEQASCSLFVQP